MYEKYLQNCFDLNQQALSVTYYIHTKPHPNTKNPANSKRKECIKKIRKLLSETGDGRKEHSINITQAKPSSHLLPILFP